MYVTENFSNPLLYIYSLDTANMQEEESILFYAKNN